LSVEIRHSSWRHRGFIPQFQMLRILLWNIDIDTDIQCLCSCYCVRLIFRTHLLHHKLLKSFLRLAAASAWVDYTLKAHTACCWGQITNILFINLLIFKVFLFLCRFWIFYFVQFFVTSSSITNTNFIHWSAGSNELQLWRAHVSYRLSDMVVHQLYFILFELYDKTTSVVCCSRRQLRFWLYVTDLKKIVPLNPIVE